jgi:hypothetical protein
MLMDKRENPIFPRWLGYFNLWAALIFTPGSFNVFFKDGPFAWNGVIAFYIPITIWAIATTVNTVYLTKAVDHQVEEEKQEAIALPADGNGHPEPASAAELAAVRKELDSLRATLMG